ncbi:MULTISPECIES: CcdB family protein [unclassified Mesorhizobium]|uniref:CcdB family protein n=1 Tax=unclassified Mesorhizobium TaxID=325217 RepID=UPI000FCAFC9E|nr:MULTISPECIES: CcdB family protein [unclassified Mesorhizobium]RUX00293.1 plasmid maintenance protein CcdB [Mesorhizobium sp. M8A.F.Ca.ET.059.01.1.1]RUX07571.1 plasmid maintenance protein CcdB [Mesorhizobium sp. M8A.F.Ca.ET.023.01.1.1]RVD52763.1 plasmid maintenance protein CcdB [Mesorhizobium sp. M8A.F.Ca.ET.023.02.2.1]TGR40510.1 plasmid maintenance protein CcdB [bacterium M00.F.Ca.ET.199.01.1.1]TGU29516.1 plasmid maintenance protein CcdB [bacterium M00.F.Ca.ET.156.01.1.1]TGU90449.1 plasmid
MPRYDVFAGRVEGNYLLDVQSDLLDNFRTRVVVPLLPFATVPPPMRKLHPIFDINGRKLVMATHLIATVPASELGESRLNLTKHHDEIVAALDMLFQGF